MIPYRDPSIENMKNNISSKNILVQCDNVALQHNNKDIIHNISFRVQQNEIVTIIGPNGSGKTTSIRILLGLIKPSIGKIEKMPGLKIGYMPQKTRIDKIMPITVYRFLSLNMDNVEDIKTISEILAFTGLLKQQMHSLSGGQLQRVMLARALLIKPDLLVLDEPTQGLDIQGQYEFYNIIENIKKENNLGILMISHDLHIVMAKTDRVICLNHHICCEGRPEDISLHPEYISLFGNNSISNGFAIYQHHHDHKHKC